jgi:hypothetical protein
MSSAARNREGAGKGDRPRAVDRKKYEESFDRIFGKREPNASEEMQAELQRLKEDDEQCR